MSALDQHLPVLARLLDHGRLEVDLALVTPGRKQDESVVLVERNVRR